MIGLQFRGLVSRLSACMAAFALAAMLVGCSGSPEELTCPAAAPVPGASRGGIVGSPWFLWPAAIALAVLVYFGLGYLVDVFTHESTDDAFIAAHVVSIAPKISGSG